MNQLLDQTLRNIVKRNPNMQVGFKEAIWHLQCLLIKGDLSHKYAYIAFGVNLE